MSFNNQFDVGLDQFYPCFLKSSTIFLLHLELKPKTGFELKTDFEFKRWSVLVRLTF